MEEALTAGRSDIAEYLAPRTILEDDKTYSTIHESQIYADEDGSGDEEEKKESSDDRSMQSEEGMRQEGYQGASAEERQAQAAQRKEANKEAADEQRLDEISHELKDKMNLHEFDVKVTKTNGGDAQANASVE